MSEELTRELPDGRSFEERVFARFDFLDARFNTMDLRFDAVKKRLDSVDARLVGLDVRVQGLEAGALDTEPIWERALAEIFLIRKGVEDLNRKLDVLTLDVMQVRADQRRAEKRVDELEPRVQK
jgi:hypothetical protein